jgi:hypothetical protein
MKIQLTSNTTTNIANSRSAYYAPQQRQGAIVEQSVVDFVQEACTEHPELAEKFNIVLEHMKLASDVHTRIISETAENTKNAWKFTILPGKSVYSYIVGSGGKAILEMFNRMLADLQSPRA